VRPADRILLLRTSGCIHLVDEATVQAVAGSSLAASTEVDRMVDHILHKPGEEHRQQTYAVGPPQHVSRSS
jgi:hypothetical protein